MQKFCPRLVRRKKRGGEERGTGRGERREGRDDCTPSSCSNTTRRARKALSGKNIKTCSSLYGPKLNVVHVTRQWFLRFKLCKARKNSGFAPVRLRFPIPPLARSLFSVPIALRVFRKSQSHSSISPNSFFRRRISTLNR